MQESVRGELNFQHRQIIQYIETKIWFYVDAMLGRESDENQGAYQQNKEVVLSLWAKYQKELLPVGRYYLKRDPHYLSRVIKEVMKAEFSCYLWFHENKVILKDQEEALLYGILQISALNASRDYLQEHFIKSIYEYYYKIGNEKKNHYISLFYGPGLMGMDLEIYDLVYEEVMQGEFVSTMEPSFLGLVAIGDTPFTEELPCKSCIASQGCEFCMINNKRKENYQ